jgi:hypothetical protein
MDAITQGTQAGVKLRYYGWGGGGGGGGGGELVLPDEKGVTEVGPDGRIKVAAKVETESWIIRGSTSCCAVIVNPFPVAF